MKNKSITLTATAIAGGGDDWKPAFIRNNDDRDIVWTSQLTFNLKRRAIEFAVVKLSNLEHLLG